MVAKEIGFIQSESACGLCAHSVTFTGSPAMARDGEVIQRQHSCHHGDI